MDKDELIEKYKKAIKFIDSALGSGGRYGRPMDIIDDYTWKKWIKIKKELEDVPENNS